MFRRPIGGITFKDVEIFCKENPEGVLLDYKTEKPKDFVRLVAAFANTYGGIIFLGVDADKATNRATKLPGVPLLPQLEEGIQTACFRSINPPISPEVALVPVDQNTVIVVCRVQESPEHPHTTDDRKRVYVRTGSVKEPIDLADIDRIEQMLKRKQGLEEKRWEIAKRLRNLDIPGRVSRDSNWISITAIPVFPHRVLCQPSHLEDIARSHGWVDSAKSEGRFLFRFPGAVIIGNPDRNGEKYVLEHHGAVQVLRHWESEPRGERKGVVLAYLIKIISGMLGEIAAILADVPFLGFVYLRILINGAENTEILIKKYATHGPSVQSSQTSGGGPYEFAVGGFDVEATEPVAELRDHAGDCILRYMQTICWGFGRTYESLEGEIKKTLKELKIPVS